MNNDIPERDIDPPEPQEPVHIADYWLTIKWDDGRTEEVSVPNHLLKELDPYIDEIEYEANRDILENQAQKYGDPDGDY